MALSFLSYDVKEKLIKYYSNNSYEKLKKHLDQDSDVNTYHKDWTNPSWEITRKCRAKLGDMTSKGFSLFKLFSSSEPVCLNDYFREWQETVCLMHMFLNENWNEDTLKFTLKVDNGEKFYCQIEKRSTEKQPGNCVLKISNELEGSYRGLSYNQFLKKVEIDKKPCDASDILQLYFLLCLEIARQLVDNAMFHDSSLAASMVLEEKLICEGKYYAKDGYYKKIKKNGQYKMGFKLFDTYQDRDKNLRQQIYRQQYEFNLQLNMFEPNKSLFNLYSTQPNVLYEHMMEPKQAKAMVKHAALTRTGHEILDRMTRSSDFSAEKWTINDDLNGINQLARMNLIYNLMKEMQMSSNVELRFNYLGNAYMLSRQNQFKLMLEAESGKLIELNDETVFNKKSEPKNYNIFIEVQANLNFMKQNAPALIPVASYLQQAVDKGHISEKDSLNYLQKACNNKWDEKTAQEFKENVISKTAPLVKNCREAEDAFWEKGRELAKNSASNYYKDEEELESELETKMASLFKEKMKTELGSRAYRENESEINDLIQNKLNDVVSSQMDQMRDRILPKTNRKEFIERKAEELFQSHLIKIKVQDENGRKTELNVPDFTPAGILKSMIFNRTGLAPCMQHLMFNSKPLTNIISEHGVSNNQTIFLMKRVGGG